MRFTDPNGEAIVMDGEYIWIYTPSTTPGQVFARRFPRTRRMVPMSWPGFSPSRWNAIRPGIYARMP
jgi:hypothetical protein